MGNCPQPDILWDHLTGPEHLRLFAVIKGVPADKVEIEVKNRLEDVNLHAESYLNIPVRAYSGGMKRRLSIAIALVGDPKVVTLDEPTTNDPVTRSDVWKCIQRAKRKSYFIDITLDGGVDVLGQNCCNVPWAHTSTWYRTSIKRRYGKGMVLTILAQEKLRMMVLYNLSKKIFLDNLRKLLVVQFT